MILELNKFIADKLVAWAFKLDPERFVVRDDKEKR